MTRRRHVLAVLCVLAGMFGGALPFAPAGAQDSTQGGPDADPVILTLDQERLFAGSRVAQQIGEEIETQAAELANENRHIEAELSAEELELTELRPTLSVEEFRKLADAFDAKVQRIRDEQDAKERDLQRLREEGRQDFLRGVTPVLTEIARERGALVILDRRTVLLSADRVDITDAVIARIDAALDEGEAPEGAPETDADPDPALPANPEMTPEPVPAPDPDPVPEAAPESAPDSAPVPENAD